MTSFWEAIDDLASLYTDAEPLYQRALAMRQKALGPNHPLVARTMEEYSALLRTTGRSAEADDMAKRAREIRQRGQ
jgi:hypothetical protein